MKARKLKQMSMGNRMFYIFNSIFWILAVFVVIYPIYLVCISSISDPYAVSRGEVLWKPIDISFVGYERILGYSELWTSYANSLFYTGATICIGIFVTLTAAYGLSRKNFPGKTLINTYYVITMFFSGGLIPTFLVMKDLGLYNTRIMMIISGCVSVWNLMVARTYIQNNIPEELYEAAVLDGASHFQYFSKIVVPLSRTIAAVLAVYYGVAKWNDYFTGLVYLKDRKKFPLQTVLKEILASLKVDLNSDFAMAMDEDVAMLAEALRVAEVSKYCIIIISTVPIVILYFFLQKYFEKGVMIGSIKG